MKHTILKIRCAWHPKNFGFELYMGTKDGYGVEGTTDGLCPECSKIEWAKGKAEELANPRGRAKKTGGRNS